ncbi:MADS-box protein defh21-like [Solanum lycopersicum]|uniref:MADS-box protein defh21-like n=1 Tax=Solanum lycopersicum TaxID=4081 RepID=UPI000532B05B|nr:MADS-box protein defh21-like [Solanum lycopersicum]
MGRNKVVMKKIEDPESRKHFYSKRKDGLVKKSNELGVHLMQSLAQSKAEREMIEKISMYDTPLFSIEAHKEKLNELQKTLSEAKEKRSSYEPQVENINNVEEADAYKGYLLGAMERVQRSKRICLLQEPLGDERFDELNWITMER